MIEDVWEPIEQYDPVGGNLALDLANTANRAARPEPKDKLRNYEDVLIWGERTGALSSGQAATLRAEAAARPGAATTALARTVELRETIYRIFAAVSVGGEPSAADVARLDSYLEEGAAQRRLHPGLDGWSWRWEGGEEPLTRLLWPVAYAAAALLTEGELARIKECGNDDCGWLFVDMSKNRSRRWCDMKDCGNRAKARRHYRRVKEAGG